MQAVDIVTPQHDLGVLAGRRGDAEEFAAHAGRAEPDPHTGSLYFDLVRLAVRRKAEPLGPQGLSAGDAEQD